MIYRNIVPNLMKLNIRKENFNMKDIENRRFMYSPTDKILVLGVQYPDNYPLISSHSEELADAGIVRGYDSYVRGWVGTGKDYPAGIIHFTPSASPQNVNLMNKAFDTIEMFKDNGAVPETVIRGLGQVWERRISSIFAAPREKVEMRK